MGRSLDALIALERLSSLAKCDENSEIFKFIEDLTLFTRHNRDLIDENPRQLYISGLIFAPTGSLVRQIYANEALGAVQHLPKTRPRWPYCFLQSLEGHNDNVQALAFSDRRTILASASSDFTIRLWNTGTGKTLRIIKGFQYPITAISFSKEGIEHFLASLSDRVVQIWDVRTGCCVYTLPNPSGYKAMTWINDEPLLRVISYDCVVEYWSPDSERLQRQVGSNEWVKHGTFLIFSGDTMTFATWSDVGPIHIWRVLGDFCSEKVALNHIWESRLVSLSYDGALVATAEKMIRIYDTNTGNTLFSLEGDFMYIQALAFAPNSRLLASGSNDRTVRLWSLSTKQCLQKLEGHRLPIISLEFSDTSDTLASGSQDATVRLWDVNAIPENEIQENPQDDLNRVTTLAVAEDGQMFAVGFSDSCIHLYHIQNEKRPTILKFHEDQISDLYFLEDGKTLASASFDGTIQLWDTASGQHLKTFVQYPAAIQGLVFTEDHEMLATILLDFTISTWTVKTEALPILVGHTSYVESAVFLKPDQILASSSRDKTIRIWDIVAGVCLRTLNGHEHWVNGLAFSQDGNTLASASPDNTVRLWDVSSGHCLKVIPHPYGVESVAFSRDQTILASISGQGIIRVWDISQSPNLKKTLIEPPSRKFGLTSTGQYLITDRGSLALDMDPQFRKPWEQPRSRIYVGREWILNGTQRVLWIPPSYRSSKFLMIRDKTVVFVGESGEALFLRFR
ncbi:uncharacterized protein N7487_010166 [Penicillium crustosum]|uniref:uncharacterized protein n=1 Tax=Penicillium crustosum TaxID=36656 RepID=UPI00239FA7FA|nr:uncharacterized protein N7487_010166 [Penicillium crustosum]KAJ5395863.1 hypothetical protein N7487_010166 [Penicillium crustosum]